MKKFCLSLIILLLGGGLLTAQETPEARIIFLGDAGNLSAEQSKIITQAAAQVIPGKTTVVFLGNNIYPNGMPLDGNTTKQKEILASQYQPFLDKGAQVYFLPGNRDWDNSGPSGLAKVRAQAATIDSLKLKEVKFLPTNGCPDPAIVALNPKSTLIILDSEWWLYPYKKDEDSENCETPTEKSVELKLNQLLFENREKNILLVLHHPLVSYGNHGGRFSWKDHLFPLTAISPELYLPLPVVGSLYPAFRRIFPTSEDLHNPEYQDFVHGLEKLIKNYPNLSIISSHDNGAQLIELPRTQHLQAITGIGSKNRFNTKGKGSLFHSEDPGYLIADLDQENNTRFTFYNLTHTAATPAFDYQKKFSPFSSLKDHVYPEFKGDSAVIAAHPGYDKVGKLGRILMGDNYRKEWAAEVTLPVIRISEIYGGLTPTKLGGGNQSVSLRLKDKNGKEYILRSIEKVPDRVIPEELRTPLTKDLVDDFFSSQHPYSSLIVPPIAEAAGVPHAHPVIGVVAPDALLGAYQSMFAGKANLLEEREPLPPTDNYTKAFKNLLKDNDNTYEPINFLNARMLDLLIGDWDRHKDQWRFHYQLNGKDKAYTLVPRDRDMVASKINGLIPYFAFHFLIMPYVYGFQENVLAGSNYYLYKSAFMNGYPENQLSKETWMKTARDFKSRITDQVLQEAVSRLPKGLDPKRNAEILHILKSRREKIPEAISKYYDFSNSIVDIRASNKNEFVNIQGSPDSGDLKITMQKISNKGNLSDTLMAKSYDAKLTKEIRIYLGKGNDSVLVNNSGSRIKLRIIGGEDQKAYNVLNTRKKIHLYDYQPGRYSGQRNRLLTKISKDTANTGYTPVNLYHGYQPLITAGYNPDDGLLLGAGIRFQQARGFRKFPYAAAHSLSFSHAFTSAAYRIKYSGEWYKLVGKADFVLNADLKSPQNSQNFFGVGNNTIFDKTGDYNWFYRTRFNWYTINASLRWTNESGSSFSAGPSFQYYEYDKDDNAGRFITYTHLLHSADSAVIDKNKAHLGFIARYQWDKRNNKTMPTFGTLLQIELKAYAGLGTYADSYAQLNPEFIFYRNLNPKQTLILANRLGASLSVGKPAFYQYAYLGGQGNLLGYRQYRFAGMHAVYNNTELRLLLSRFGNAAFQGQFGISGFYDIGRVWASHEISQKWHQSVGAGVYLVPAMAFVLQFNMGYSTEGWFPTFGMGFRF